MKDAYYYSRTEAVLIIKAYGKGSFIMYAKFSEKLTLLT